MDCFSKNKALWTKVFLLDGSGKTFTFTKPLLRVTMASVYQLICSALTGSLCVCVLQVMKRAENLGSAFLHKGHSKTTDPHIGIFSQNRPEVQKKSLSFYPSINFLFVFLSLFQSNNKYVVFLCFGSMMLVCVSSGPSVR